MIAVGAWAQQLRHEGVAARLVFDTYYPESGRYGHGAAMDAAEEVFVADSQAVSAQLRYLPDTVIHRNTLVAVNMIATVEYFLGDADRAKRWLIASPAPAATATDRTLLDQALRYVRTDTLRELPGWETEVDETWQARATALASYRRRLAADADTGAVLESLLHMHANRAIGVDRDREATCRRLARHAALAQTAKRAGDHR